jgi:GntR family transcriptional repressor for pyruvate dehydrogenase complex
VDSIYKEIRVSKVSDEIVDQIKKLILDGKLEPGEKLPPEREFAELLGVGRSSLREAMNTLETLGYLEIKKRKGNFIKALSSSITLDPLTRLFDEKTETLFQLYEVRNDIEMASAYWAAIRRTQEDMEKIESCLSQMKQSDKEERSWWKEDLSFHLAVAQASHNFLRVHILKDLFDLSANYVEEMFTRILQKPHNNAVLIEHHESVFRAVKEKNPEKAMSVMHAHFTWSNDKIKAHLSV